MVLEPGTYTIKAQEKDKYVGRSIAEDRSYSPKKILVLDDPPETPEWKLETTDGETFVMSTRNSPTAKIDKDVFAILTDDPEPTSWRVRPQFQMGDDTYIITGSDYDDERLGWTVPTDEEGEPQIHLQVVIVLRSNPPTFLPNQLFVIKKVN